MKNLTIAVLAAAGTFAISTKDAHAQANMGMTIVVEDVCDVASTSPTDLNFGTHKALNAALHESIAGGITVACSKGTAYNIGLDAGLNGAGNINARKMELAGQFVAYQLYANVERTAVWGNTIGTDTVTGSGTGSVQNIPIYGSVPAQDTPDPGRYNDIVHVTITY